MFNMEMILLFKFYYYRLVYNIIATYKISQEKNEISDKGKKTENFAVNTFISQIVAYCSAL